MLSEEKGEEREEEDDDEEEEEEEQTEEDPLCASRTCVYRRTRTFEVTGFVYFFFSSE